MRLEVGRKSAAAVLTSNRSCCSSRGRPSMRLRKRGTCSVWVHGQGKATEEVGGAEARAEQQALSRCAGGA